MVSYKTINVLILLGLFVGLVLYDEKLENNTDVGKYEKSKKMLYGIIFTLYSAYVCTLFLPTKRTSTMILLILLGIIALVAFFMKVMGIRKMKDVSDFLSNVFTKVDTNQNAKLMQKINVSHSFPVSTSHKQSVITFSIYLDVVNNFNNKVKLLTLNECPIIEYNNANHTFDFVQYSCTSELKYSVPTSYRKWIKFKVECIESWKEGEDTDPKPIIFGIEMDDVQVYSNKVYDLDSKITTITIGDNDSKDIGFMKDVNIDF